jgi:pyruvate/2-oxoglutarate dehydrogenase complex dihydrolipoamide dehydrogenase (E3) component
MATYDRNLIVIGAGSAGLIAALVGATVRARVTLIESGQMGGDCLNTGCVPSKALIRAARAAHEIRQAPRFGIHAGEPQVDFAAVMARIRAVISEIEPKDSAARYRGLGVECLAGEAVLDDGHHVRVRTDDGEQRLSGRAIVLATGATPFVPPIPGLEAVAPLTSENVWSLETLPARLLVMGGGPIGCELAQSFARLGSAVTLIDMESQLLPKEDPETSRLMESVLRRDGVDVLLGHRAVAVEASDTGRGGMLVAEGGEGGASTRIEFDRILVAVGRRARDSAGLAAAGVALNGDGTIAVDRHLRTSLRSVYACGDAVGPYQFTHMASHQAWYAAVNALFGRIWKFAANYDVVPWATYTDPEVARVGLSEREAREKGIPVEVVRYDLDDLDRALTEGASEGWVKVLVKPGTDKILGAQVVGLEAGELIAEFVLAMTHGLGLKKIMGTIHVYPTRMEAAKLVAGTWRRAHAPERMLGLVGRVFDRLR